MADWHLYLVRTRHGNLYTGIATDVKRRFAEHQAGDKRSAKYLRGRGPLALVWHLRLGDRSLALRVERRIKQLAKDKKEDLVFNKPKRAALLGCLGLGQTT